jgi:hypothetical protein
VAGIRKSIPHCRGVDVHDQRQTSGPPAVQALKTALPEPGDEIRTRNCYASTIVPASCAHSSAARLLTGLRYRSGELVILIDKKLLPP